MYIKKRTSQEVKTDQILKAFLVPLERSLQSEAP